MFTVCPKCNLKLVVTAADLRVAQGYVRCGRCSNVFNALIGLSDEQQAVLAQEAGETESRESAATATRDSEAREGARIDEQTDEPAQEPAEGDPEEPAETRSDAELEFDPTQTDVSEVFIEPSLDENGPTGTFESITLSSEDELAAEDEIEAEWSPPPGPADSSPPAGHTKAPDTPPKSTDTPPRSTDTPPRSTDTPPKSTETPPKSTDARAKPAAASSGLAAPSAASVPEFEMDDLLGPASRSAPAARASPPPAQRPDTQRREAQRSDAQPPQEQRPEAQHAAITRGSAGSSVQTRQADRPALAPVRTSPPVSRRIKSESLDSVREAVEARPMRPPPSPAAGAGTRRDYVLRAAVAGLGVLLGAQVVHHYRSALATIGWLRPPLSAIYGALGAPLVPRWDVTAYEVHQLGAVAGADIPGSLTVRASIKNNASMPQPLPLLRVTVQDRFGNHVASRDVPPRAYLPKASSGSVYLASGQRVDAEVELVDPGASAVGFEIDACLADSGGRVSCANDASNASAER